MSEYQQGFESIPGQAEGNETQEIDLLWRGSTVLNNMDGGILLSTATDAGHSGNTSLLRAGLLLGQITSSGKWTTWAPTASDGSEKIAGILARSKSLSEGVDKYCGSILTEGYVKAERIIIPGAASAALASADLEFIIRDQLAERFKLDDIRNVMIPRTVNLTADKTIDRTFHGSVITNIGAAGTVIVTLPVPKRGYRLQLRQLSNQILRIGTPSAGQLKLSDATTAQTLDLPAATNKVLDVYGIGSTYHAVIYGATS